MFSHYRVITFLVFVGLTDSAYYKCPSTLQNVLFHLSIYGDTCYHFVVDQEKDFSDAQKYCKDNGGNLVSVRSKEINNFIANVLERLYSVKYSPVWIGLRYFGQAGVYKWVDDSKLGKYQNFMEATAVYGEDCVAIVPNSRLWRDYPCETNLIEWPNKKRFICEYAAVFSDTTANPKTISSSSITTTPAIAPTSTTITTTTTTSSTTSHPFTITVNDCPKVLARDNYLKVFDNKCFRFVFHDAKTFEDANTYCQVGGGNLVTVHNKFIGTFIQQRSLLLSGEHDVSVWIGLHYDTGRQKLVWVDGSPFAYVNFVTQNYSGYDLCVSLDMTNGKWVWMGCSQQRLPFVCEYPALVEPTTIFTPPTATKSNRKPSITVNDCPGILIRDKYLKVFDRKCLMFEFDQLKNFSDADAHCRGGGGKLVTINRGKMNTFVQKQLYSLTGVHSFTAWMGLRYEVNYRLFVWRDGTPFLYTNFRDNHFSETDACVSLSETDGKWLPMDCSQRLPFVCEFWPIDRTRPATKTSK